MFWEWKMFVEWLLDFHYYLKQILANISEDV